MTMTNANVGERKTKMRVFKNESHEMKCSMKCPSLGDMLLHGSHLIKT